MQDYSGTKYLKLLFLEFPKTVFIFKSLYDNDMSEYYNKIVIEKYI